MIDEQNCQACNENKNQDKSLNAAKELANFNQKNIKNQKCEEDR